MNLGMSSFLRKVYLFILSILLYRIVFLHVNVFIYLFTYLFMYLHVFKVILLNGKVFDQNT